MATPHGHGWAVYGRAGPLYGAPGAYGRGTGLVARGQLGHPARGAAGARGLPDSSWPECRQAAYRPGMASTAQVARNRYAAATRHGKPSQELEQLRRDLELAKLTQHVKEVAAKLGPLTDSEREKVADLLSIV